MSKRILFIILSTLVPRIYRRTASNNQRLVKAEHIQILDPSIDRLNVNVPKVNLHRVRQTVSRARRPAQRNYLLNVTICSTQQCKQGVVQTLAEFFFAMETTQVTLQ